MTVHMPFRHRGERGPRAKTAGPDFLSAGFRPFFLLGALYGPLALAIGYAWPRPHWHAHEMLFGYVFAVITGFLFTAVRNWTGMPTPVGGALAAIAGLWIAARVLAVISFPAAALADAAFSVAVAWGIGRPLIAKLAVEAARVTGVARAAGALFAAWCEYESDRDRPVEAAVIRGRSERAHRGRISA